MKNEKSSYHEAKFSEEMKEIISLSREEALKLGNNYIGLEHFLLGIIDLGIKSVGLKLINDVAPSINLSLLRELIEEHLQEDKKPLPKDLNLPLNTSIERALKLSVLEAKTSKVNEINSGHVLLAMLKSNDKDLSFIEMLAKFGLTYALLSSSRSLKIERLRNMRLESYNEDVESISLFFDTNEFSNKEIATIIAYLSEVYSSISGDSLEIVGSSSFEFNRCLQPVY